MKIKNALILEDYEQELRRQERTNRSINDTYKSEWYRKEDGKRLKRPPTKKRRKLEGKRKWKNKDEQYGLLRAQMSIRRFNKKRAAMKAVEEEYKGREGINSI